MDKPHDHRCIFRRPPVTHRYPPFPACFSAGKHGCCRYSRSAWSCRRCGHTGADARQRRQKSGSAFGRYWRQGAVDQRAGTRTGRWAYRYRGTFDERRRNRPPRYFPHRRDVAACRCSRPIDRCYVGRSLATRCARRYVQPASCRPAITPATGPSDRAATRQCCHPFGADRGGRGRCHAVGSRRAGTIGHA